MVIAFIAFTSITSQLFAQEATSKTTGKTMAMDDWHQDAASKASGQHIKEAKLTCRVVTTETGCSITFEYDVKSPRDVATGQSSGKRQHGTVKIVKELSVNVLDNSVAEVKSPRDAASGQASGKRMHNPIITKEYDKSSPMLAKRTSSSSTTSTGIAIDEPGVQKVSMQDLHFTMSCGGKSTQISCVDGECDIPTDSCPNGDCSLTADWSWGVSQGGSSKRCSVDFLLEIEDGVCMAINTKGSPVSKGTTKK